MRSYYRKSKQDMTEGYTEDVWSSNGDGCNALILPAKKKSKTKVKRQSNKGKTEGDAHLNKNQKRKLQQLQEEKEKKDLELKSYKILEKYKIPDDTYLLLQSSGNIAQVETMRQKLRRAVQLSRAGLEVPPDVPLFKQRNTMGASKEKATVGSDSSKSHSKEDCQDSNDLSCLISEKIDLKSSQHVDNCLEPTCIIKLSNAPVGSDTALPSPEFVDKKIVTSMQEDLKNSQNVSCKYDGEKNIQSQNLERHRSKLDSHNSSISFDCLIQKPLNVIAPVHVVRPDEVEQKRGDLPIVMMEQEIMEAINEHSTVIICGETGCGKTTQVPQFLYEAGFGSRRGVIGVTQPRRVAVLATAKRVAFEMGLRLGKEIGFQVRHDKRVGDSCSIKFMTDGILLREVQSDFLLKRYSVIVLDEAHERSLNTDILVGMLSRIIQVRQKLYEEQQEQTLSGVKLAAKNMITPLKLLLMSATLRVEDFVSGCRLFHEPPPVVEVPTRQFPVTIHFSKKTETVDYVGQAYKKVMSIHKRLPPGGILVFLTGQREIEFLCRKLQKASVELTKKTKKSSVANTDGAKISGVDSFEQDPLTKNIYEAFEVDEEPDDQESQLESSESGMESDQTVSSEDDDSFDRGTTEENSTVPDALREPGSLSSLKAAFEALAGNKKDENYEENPNLPITDKCSNPSLDSHRSHEVDSNFAGPLYVLPLYAMLPARAQLRVFEEVPKGERLVVVATNVAETSLTIPGIKYVVDTGREKVKNYNCANGMASYEVQWISKASASQRAGRAGRTGPGHCYRLYSSAVFSNIFSDFSTPEIQKIPVDGVFLLMKYMGIDKVANFPFPTPPESTALEEAEHCLKILEALDSQGRLTSIGKAMAQYPMSPRHCRMLLTVIEIMGRWPDYARVNIVLGYTVAAAAALSSSNPFIMQSEADDKRGVDLDQDEKTKIMGDHEILDQQRKSKQKQQKAMAKAARAKFCNPTSDALTIAYALQLFELAENPSEFCRTNCLHLKTMEEMSKLRKQLLHLVFYRSSISRSEQEFSWTHGNLKDVECAWRVFSDKNPLLLNEEELLGQAICAGWADRVAKRFRAVSEASDRKKKSNGIKYQACMVKETVFIHRLSSVAQSAPEFVVYNELVEMKQPYMHGVTSVKSDWLMKYATSLCTFSGPLQDPKPYYEPLTDQVMCWVSASFGPHLWELPLHSLPVKNEKLRVSIFASALLQGKVLPCLKSAQKFLAANPCSILKAEAASQRRVGELLNKLMTRLRVVDSRARLREIWNENPQELHDEILCWFQEKFHGQFEELWQDMHYQVSLEARRLFPKFIKQKKRILIHPDSGKKCQKARYS